MKEHRKRVFYLLFLVPLLLSAQYKNDYLPFEKSLTLLDALFMDPVATLHKNVAANTLLTNEEAEGYYSKMIFFKSQLLQSGQLYPANAITAYVDSVVSGMLAAEPKLKNGIKIFVTRFTSANAFCFPDGSIFINIGLVASVNSEAELAFVLAHEIAHYAEQHSVKDVKRLAEIQKAEINFFNKGSSLFRSLKFSRESEYEADSWALQLLVNSGYPADAAGTALMRLKSHETDSATLNFKAVFDSEDFMIDTAWYSAKAVRRNKAHFRDNQDDPVTSGKLDDLFQTHPDLEKRKEALDLIAKNLKRKNIPASRVTSFAAVHELAVFERIENNYRDQDYLNAMINTIHLLQKYPDNVYLHVTISKSLYWLSYYKEINENALPAMGDPGESGADFYRFYSIMNQVSLKDAKKIAYLYIANRSEKYNDREPVLFYLAVNTENYLGKNAAKNYYRDYSVKYPEGRFSVVTKAKLQ